MLSIVFFSLLLTASIWDVMTFTIPNWLTIPGCAVLAAITFFNGQDLLSFALSASFSAGFLAVLSWILKGRLGMGDVKLSLSISGVLGIYYWLISLFIASAISLCTAFWISWDKTGNGRGKPIPFAPFLTIGAGIAYWMRAKGFDLP